MEIIVDPALPGEPFQRLIESLLPRWSGLPARPERIEVVATERGTIPGLGLGGFSGRAGLIRAMIHPQIAAPDLSENAAFARILTHEAHHAARWSGPGYGATLGEALVTEGLAGQFVQEVHGTPPEPWEDAIGPDEEAAAASRATECWTETGYDHGEWFFGMGDLPLWAGYTLAYRRIGVWLSRNPGKSPACAAHNVADRFHAAFRSAG